MSEPLLSYKSVIFWAWFSPSSLHSFNSCHSALSSPLTHRSSCFGVLWGLSFLQVFLPHTEGSDRLLISAAAHEVDISTSAPSKGFAPPPAANRRFYLEFSPFGVILRVTTPTRLCSARRAARYLPEMTNFPVKPDVTGRLSESPQTRRLLLLPKLAEGSYLKVVIIRLRSLITHTHTF